jgi:hypothetical protein
MSIQILQSIIKANKQDALFDKAAKTALLQKTWYYGSNQDEQITSYRERETKPQKDQRKRVSVKRSKHVIGKIENIINQLDIMDKPSTNVITKNDQQKELLEDWIYNNNISQLAFEFTKLYNIVDANSFVICRVDNEMNIQFKVTESANVWACSVMNANIQYVAFRYERQLQDKKVYDFEYYDNNGYIIAEHYEGAKNEGERIGDYVYSVQLTGKMFAFRIGYKRNTESEFKICDSILDKASELIKSLIRIGGDFDVDLLTHGILQKSSYARKCTFTQVANDTEYRCEGGTIYENGAPKSTCHKCNGTGLDIHTSSQDIILFPYPDDPTQLVNLAGMTDIKFAPAANFEFKKKEILELEQAIVDTVFSNTEISKSETATNVTATQKVIDQQGVYSTLEQLGNQVSELFIWMCECKANIEGYTDVEFLHGYTLSLKLDSVETLSEKRRILLDANAPMEVISAVDMAILQKQHIDSPQFLNRFLVWEHYRPFKNKRPELITNILAGLPNTFGAKILYNFFDDIKSEIESEIGDRFYETTDEQRKSIINEKVQVIRAELESFEPQRMTFDNDPIDDLI